MGEPIFGKRQRYISNNLIRTELTFLVLLIPIIKYNLIIIIMKPKLILHVNDRDKFLHVKFI